MLEARGREIGGGGAFVGDCSCILGSKAMAIDGFLRAWSFQVGFSGVMLGSGSWTACVG
jgi:hypothetical protein